MTEIGWCSEGFANCLCVPSPLARPRVLHKQTIMKLPTTGQKYTTRCTLILLWISAVILAVTYAVSRNTYGFNGMSSISISLLPNLKNATFHTDISASWTKKQLILDKLPDVTAPNFAEQGSAVHGPSVGLLKGLSDNHEFEKSPGDVQVPQMSKSSKLHLTSPLENEPLSRHSNGLAPPFLPSPQEAPKLVDGNGSVNSVISSLVEEQKPPLPNTNSTGPKQLYLPSQEVQNSSERTYPKDSKDFSFKKVNEEAPVRDELDKVLASTADENKTVIIISLNSAWSGNGSMIDLFLESFHIGEGTKELLRHLLIVSVDAKAYDHCIKIHPHCYILRTQGVDFSAEKKYMTQDYLRMMWRRLGFLGDILKRGYSFVFTISCGSGIPSLFSHKMLTSRLLRMVSMGELRTSAIVQTVASNLFDQTTRQSVSMTIGINQDGCFQVKMNKM
ncbi:uncharacterized protein LOC116266169 isoform X3 [Nymphaea colorata]|uniref:uncharacterized protein LOC116266169 isoform X3 n=1 Tax=Nymphaea colorata TaxID=210225 RepID=UPI00129D7525|nr:uncharacterized protein LOC116266169 isoform X3 [Nymphaea colorata]